MDNPENDFGETLDGLPARPAASLGVRYDLLGEVGSGGMGIVYKARERETGEIVALKVLKPEIAADQAAMERFRNELRLARKITHKNVCRIHDFNRAEGTAYISMEFVDGESLRHILKRFGGLPLRRIAQQICAGLREAHAQGVVHRDLKPENVMLDRAGNVKIMDFGIARSVETGATATLGAIAGTPAYMAPEQAQGKAVDHRADIYALGLILYEMYTGTAAFSGDSVATLVLKQISETPPPPRELEPTIPVHIERAVVKCLEKDPARRFRSVDELEAALTQQPEAKPPVAEGAEVPLPLHLTRWQRSDWALVFLAIAGLALFFPFFERTSLAPRSKVSFDRSVLRRIAQEYAQRLGAPLGKESQISVVPYPLEYDFVAQRAGAPVALELANNPVPYWKWTVEWENDTRVRVDHRGSLQGLTRNFPASPAPGSTIERLPIEEARPLAEKALREFFNRDPALLILETAAGDTWRGHAAVVFIWADRNDYHGLRRRFIVWLVGRETAALNTWFDLPAGYVSPNVFMQILPAFALILVIAMLGFSQRQQVHLGARWRTTLVALMFLVFAWHRWWAGDVIPNCVMGGLAVALLGFFASVAMERSVCRIAPARFSIFVRLFDRRGASEPCGLAILRGTFVGLALLGADTFLVWLGTNRLGMRLDFVRHIISQAQLYLSNPWPSSSIFLGALNYGLAVMFVGFFASFVARFVHRSWRAAFLAAALSAAMLAIPGLSLGAVQPYQWRLPLLLLDCLILVWSFNRFDLLTSVWAGFTFAFWWQNYFLLVMFEPTGAVEQWMAFAAWGLFVVTAGAVAFQSALRGAYRRASAAFE